MHDSAVSLSDVELSWIFPVRAVKKSTIMRNGQMKRS